MLGFMWNRRSGKHFNEQRWEKYISYSDWYLRLLPDYRRLIKKAEKYPELADEIKEGAYNFFEKHLEKGDFILAERGPNLDEERKPLDTIVIHHTSNEPGITWQRLDAIQLIRLYALYYAAPSEQEKHFKGQPIWSNHFRGDRQVFYAYHWLVRMDGTVERLLGDKEIGWQAGNWDINCRSVAICLDNDYEHSEPSEVVLDAVVKLIMQNYSHVSPDRILGHREANPKTACPGDLFLNGWKSKMLERMIAG